MVVFVSAGVVFIAVVSLAEVVSVLLVFSPPPPHELRKNSPDAYKSKQVNLREFIVFGFNS
jgi:hypothetical protein